MRIKICGITKPEQGKAIANSGATALGFICVPTSPRYVEVGEIQAIIEQLPEKVNKIGVYANSPLDEVKQIAIQSGFTGIQLHGDESPEFCQQLSRDLPDVEIIKALRVNSVEHLQAATKYSFYVDTLLLDAYDPQQLGGTGKTLNWAMLQEFYPGCPWFLAGGLTPDNIIEALTQVKPNGIDLSSGVERAPGDKDLDKVTLLFHRLNDFRLLGGQESNVKR